MHNGLDMSSAFDIIDHHFFESLPKRINLQSVVVQFIRNSFESFETSYDN